MQRFKGRLRYLWWFNRPWILITNEGDIDLWPHVNRHFLSLNGKRAVQNHEIDGYSLTAKEDSDHVFTYIPDKNILLKKQEGFGLTNVHAYLDSVLCELSGRLIEIEIDEGKYISIKADPAEDVHKVYYVGEGNSCEVSPGMEHAVCKVGSPECCIFLTFGPDGFACDKFNGPVARVVLDRLAKGKMVAKRIGNCAIAGRKEKSAFAQPRKVLPFVRKNM